MDDPLVVPYALRHPILKGLLHHLPGELLLAPVRTFWRRGAELLRSLFRGLEDFPPLVDGFVLGVIDEAGRGIVP